MKSGKLLADWLRVFCTDGQQEGLQHPARGAVPHSCLHPLCPFLPFYPSSSVISLVTLPMSNWGPAPTKTLNQGKVHGPQKSSQTQHREQRKSGKINVVSALSSGKDLWDAAWQGGVDRRDAQHLRKYCKRNGGTDPFAEEPGSGMDK